MKPAADSWRPVLAILCYAVLVIVVGALLAPWLFWLVQWLAGNFDSFARLARHPFKRVFNRALLIVALLGLWPLLRNVGFRSWAQFGFGRRRDWWRQVLFGFLLGVIGLLLTVIVRQGHVAMAVSAGLVGKLLATAIAVAVIEEAFFRGGLQGALQRAFHWLPALLVASVIYSALHFLKPIGVKIAADTVRWSSGFTCLGEIVSKSYSALGVATAFVTLCLAGCLLGWAFQRTQALYLSIGLHAGWVLANEFFRATAQITIVEDWLAWPALLVQWVVLAWFCRSRSPAVV